MLTLDDLNARLDRYMAKKRAVAGRYALRDLSKELGYSIQQISDVRRGRRTLKADFAQKVRDLTDLKPEDHTDLTADQLAAMQDVVHFQMLSLALVRGARADAQWIASQLKLTLDYAQEVFDRLQRLGLIRVIGDTFEPTHTHLTTQRAATTEVMLKRYRQHSSLAFDAYVKEPTDERSFQARTFALPRERLDEAKAIIRRALIEIDQLESPGADRVYTCFVQLFPVSGPAQPPVDEKLH